MILRRKLLREYSAEPVLTSIAGNDEWRSIKFRGMEYWFGYQDLLEFQEGSSVTLFPKGFESMVPQELSIFVFSSNARQWFIKVA